MRRTLCKHGANPRLWGRLVAGDVGNLAERHSKSEAFTTQLAHTSISHISLGLARDLVRQPRVNHGLAVTGTTMLCGPPS